MPLGRQSWVLLEGCSVGQRGDEVVLKSGDVVSGGRALHVVTNGEDVFTKLVSLEEIPGIRDANVRDSRVLGAVEPDLAGRRNQDFQGLHHCHARKGHRRLAPGRGTQLPLAVRVHFRVREGRLTGGTQSGSNKPVCNVTARLVLLMTCWSWPFRWRSCRDQVDGANLAVMEVVSRAHQLVQGTNGTLRTGGLGQHAGRDKAESTRRGVALAPALARSPTREGNGDPESTPQGT